MRRAASWRGWRVASGGDSVGFTDGSSAPLSATLSRPSLIDSARAIGAEVSSRRVDDDGSFAEPAPVYMLGLTISSWSGRATACPSAPDGVHADEATA